MYTERSEIRITNNLGITYLFNVIFVIFVLLILSKINTYIPTPYIHIEIQREKIIVM